MMEYVVVEFVRGDVEVAEVYGPFRTRDEATKFASDRLASCGWYVTELVPPGGERS